MDIAGRGESQTCHLLIKTNQEAKDDIDETNSAAYSAPHLRQEPSDWRAPAIVLAFECLESVAFYGIATNLVVYFQLVIHGSNAASAANVSTWTGTSYLTPILGAIAADTFLGKYRTILYSLLMYIFGMLLVTISSSHDMISPIVCRSTSCSSMTSWNIAFFFGLYFVAVGSGGVKSSLLPFGVEQFDDDNPEDRRRKASFFSWFYLCLDFGAVVSGTLIVWLQENIDWGIGYAISTACLVLAFVGFMLGYRTYKLMTPRGSPLKSICQVFVASVWKIRMEAPNDSSLLYETDDPASENAPLLPKLQHTGDFCFLDKAAIMTKSDVEGSVLRNSWWMCTVTQVEEVKILLRLLPVWATNVVVSAAYAQMGATFIQQGSAMNTKFLSFSVPPASLGSVEVIFVVALVLFYEKVAVPIFRSFSSTGAEPSQLQRMGAGRLLVTLAMAAAALTERARLTISEKGELMHISWQLPQYFLTAAAEVFCFITQLEFFYGQAPDSMKSLCTSLALLSIALGSYLSSLITTILSRLTRREGSSGWVPDDLDHGHLDYFFWTMTAICMLNFVAFVAIATNYKLKKVVLQV